MSEPFDLIVIGSGPAGEKGAAQAAYFGKRVALVEGEPDLGGAGVNTGTVPSKTLRETALYFSGLRQHGLYGVDYSIRQDISVRDFMYREREVVRTLRGLIEANLGRHRVDVVRGQAAFLDPHTVRVRAGGAAEGAPDRVLTAPVILIATGSMPNWPEGIPRDGRLYDSDTILRMDRLPLSLVVVGAGVIGCEYASMFAALGIEVTLLGGRDRLLPFLDHEIADLLRREMERAGVRMRLGTTVQRYEPAGERARLLLSSGEALECEKVLIAAGRLGNTDGLDMAGAGVIADSRGIIKVNEHYQTAISHIYAAGDVIGFPALAAVSMEQARVAMCHAFDLKYKSRVSALLPVAVYTIPEVAMAGETEETCREKHIRYCVGRASFGDNARGQIIGDVTGEIKLIFSPADQRLLGVHVVGEIASELIHIGQACLQLGGTLDFFIQTVFNYPTLGEVYKYAAYDGLGNLARMAAGEPVAAPTAVPDQRRPSPRPS